MQTLWQDLRYSARILLKQPGFALIAVLTLALGIGANTAIFSIVNAVLLRPLPYQEPERIMLLWGKNPRLQLNMTDFPISYGDFLDLRAQSRTFESLAAFYPNSVNLTGDANPEHLGAVNVSSNVLQTLGIAPALGRTFAPAEEQPGRERVVLLSDRLWRRRFGADPGLLGKLIQLNGEAHTVIGVLPATFEFPQRDDLLLAYGFPRQADVWKPITPALEELKGRHNHVLIVMGRLQRGVSQAQAQTEINTLAADIAAHYPKVRSAGWHVALAALSEQITGKLRQPLLALLAAVGLVLLVACANVANLLLARAAGRQQEIALRLALGASHWRLVRQLLTESLLLAFTGSLAGLLLAAWGVELLLTLSPESLPRLGKVGLDGRVFGFTLLSAVLTGLVCGLAPAWQAARQNLNEALKAGGRGETGGRQRTRRLFVIAEVALTFVLLVSAGLLLRSFARLQQVELGFEPHNVLALQLDLPESKYANAQQRSAFFDRLTEQVAALPGVKAVGLAWQLPLGGSDAGTGFVIEDRPTDPAAPGWLAGIRRVNAGYFRAIGTPLKQGREFNVTDQQSADRKIIINETMARRFWPSESPIGKRLGALRASFEIIGVAQDVKYAGLDVASAPEMYVLSKLPTMNLLVRTTGEPLSLVPAIRQQVAFLDKDQPISEITTLAQRVSEAAASRRFNLLLLTLFALLALGLATVGLYGVMSYTVTQSTRELGLRMALGAQAGDLWRLVIGQGMALVLAGLGVGVLGALAAARLLQTLLYHTSALDAATFVSVALLLALVTLLACWIPARRAMRVDPLIALRCE